jgi:hypothetical protein
VNWEAPYLVKPRCEQRAYLSLHGSTDFDPAEVGTVIGLVPTRSYRAGDPAPLPHRVRRASGWYLDVPRRDTEDTEAVVVELLDVLEPYVDRIAEARRRWDLGATIEVVTEAYPGRYEGGEFVRSTPGDRVRADHPAAARPPGRHFRHRPVHLRRRTGPERLTAARPSLSAVSPAWVGDVSRRPVRHSGAVSPDSPVTRGRV